MNQIPFTPSFQLNNKRALVTGGAQGLGLASSAALARAGAHVTIASRNLDTIRSATKKLKELGFQAEGFQLDLTEIENVQKFFNDKEQFDIVVNSSGCTRNSPALETKEEDFDLVMNLNVKGAYFVAIEAAKKMSKGGSIIHISSQMGLVGGIERAVYCASKHAVEGMVKAMAIEWGPKKIRINSICPTFIRTKLTEKTLDDQEKLNWIMSNIKLGELGQVEDIMGAIVYLASDASRMVTGTNIVIDGGWTAA